MTTIDGASEADAGTVQQRAVERLVERLRRQFPDVPFDDLMAATESEFERYEGSRIYDYVPIFVERSIRAQLATRELGL